MINGCTKYLNGPCVCDDSDKCETLQSQQKFKQIEQQRLIDKVRNKGIEYCQTKGSEHYQQIREKEGLDAIELAIINNEFEDFALVNIKKYAMRFKHTRNLNDLKKIADYAHLLCGVELDKEIKEG